MEERHLSLSDAADALGISERTAYRWINLGKLRAYKPGRDYRIPESAIREAVEESEVRPKAQSRSSLEPPLFNGLEDERPLSITTEAILAAAQEWRISVSKPDATADEISAAVDAAMSLCEGLVEQVSKPSVSWHDAERLEAVRTAGHLLEIAEAGNNLILDSERKDQATQRKEHLRVVRDRISA